MQWLSTAARGRALALGTLVAAVLVPGALSRGPSAIADTLPTSTITGLGTLPGSTGSIPSDTLTGTITPMPTAERGLGASNVCDQKHPVEGQDDQGHRNFYCWTATPTATATPTPAATLPAGNVRLTGVVTDPEGSPIQGVPVRAWSFDTGTAGATVTTTAGGIYTLAVPPGRYDLVAAGNVPYTQQQLGSVDATGASGGATFTRNLTLRPNDTTVSGTLAVAVAGGGTVPAPSGLRVALLLKSTFSDSTRTPFYEVAGATSGVGAYSFTAAAGTYSLARAYQNGSGYAQRGHDWRNPVVTAPSASFDFVLPMVAASGGPCIPPQCMVSVSGAGYFPAQVVTLRLRSLSTLEYAPVGTAMANASGVFDATGSNAITFGPPAAGTYNLVASQDLAGWTQYKYARLATPYEVQPASSTATPSSSPTAQ